ncbi:MAG: LacI family DNA-binding transcriptional regulator [Homoserinimonas sp.]
MSNDSTEAPGRAARSSVRATMRDVAKHAGVGLSTVSRVVNGDGSVSTKRTQAVEAAISELGFRRNDFARHLRMGAAASIGLLIESVADPFFSLLNQAVEEVVLGRDSLLLSASSHQDADRAKKLVLAFSSRRVDGLIITPSDPQDVSYLRTELAAGVKMVFVDRPVHGIDADTVLTDNLGGARTGVEHLIAHGHKRIALFSDRASLYTTVNRRAGYTQALEHARLPVDPSLINSSEDGRYDFTADLTRMLAMPHPPTAIFCSNNRATVEILRELAKLPQRPALVGFDDFELADAMTPGVTVVAQDALAMGRTAAELLFARLDGATGPTQTISLGTTLIARGSGEIRP